MLASIFKNLRAVEQSTGLHMYVVGGFVRDLFLRKNTSKDIDVVVVGDALQVAKAYDENF
jgi:tRNA nucleotidyltransferase/poly(A) polymerase